MCRVYLIDTTHVRSEKRAQAAYLCDLKHRCKQQTAQSQQRGAPSHFYEQIKRHGRQTHFVVLLDHNATLCS